MSGGIFETWAPKYWAKGIPVIPLKPSEKRPAIPKWQNYGLVMPSAEEQAAWLSAFPNHNIGVPAGIASNLVGIDIDTDDPVVMDIVNKVCGISPWKRRGKKGCIVVYQNNGERSFNILSGTKSLLQVFASSGQFALPPSIHPDTREPYTANCELLTVLDQLPALPKGFEQTLRDALNEAGYQVTSNNALKISHFVPAGARDNAMTSHAGILARAITRGERTLVEALGEMEHWVVNYTERVAGDELSVDKAQKKVIEFLVRDVMGPHQRRLPIGWDTGLTPEEKKNLGLDFGADQEVWSGERIKDYLKGEFDRIGKPELPEWDQAVQIGLSHIARNVNMNALEVDRLLRYIMQTSQSQFPITALRKRLAELKKGEMEGQNQNEIAEAMLEDERQFGEIRHWKGVMWQWRGAFWEKMDDVKLLKRIAEEYGELPAARKESDHRGILRCMKTKCEGQLHSIEVRGLNFANGFLTENLDLLPHDPKFGCTYVLSYRYRPEIAGHFPLFQQFLHDCWGEDPDFHDKVAALQEAMAVTMFRRGKTYERAICLFGTAKSGKTRIIEMLKGLLPPSCVSSVPPHDFEDKFKVTELHNAMMNEAGELSETRFIPGDMLKKITSGAQLQGQYKGQQIFNFIPECTHWFASNVLPKSKDTTDGFNRRWLILRFDHPVSEEKKIPDIEKIILASEAEAIAAWAVLGMERMVRNGNFTMPASHQIYLEQLANNSNTVRYFLANCTDIIVGRRRVEGKRRVEVMSDDNLYAAYNVFCTINMGTRGFGRQKFYELMQGLQGEFGFEQETVADNDGHGRTMYKWISPQK